MKPFVKHALLALAITLSSATTSFAAAGHSHDAPAIPQLEWSFEGIGSHWDKAQILRGWKVATQVCLQCHSFKYISPRDLTLLGLTEDQAKELAAQVDRKLNDPLISALTEDDAKAAYGMAVPDLSVMTIARKDGVNYTHALLTGYTEAPADFTGVNYNKYFPGNSIAMPNPLSDGIVDYADGSPTTVEQYSRDVTAFMAWAADPHRITRQTLGVYVLLYVLIFAALSYITMKMIWRNVKKK